MLDTMEYIAGLSLPHENYSGLHAKRSFVVRPHMKLTKLADTDEMPDTIHGFEFTGAVPNPMVLGLDLL